MKAPGVAAWRLRRDAGAIRVEPGAVFEDGEPRAAPVLILAGAVYPADGARIRWKLSKDEG